MSAAVQNLSGRPTTATAVYTNAQIAPSLGRNLAACPATGNCTATVTATILQPNTLFEKRYTLADVRVSKNFRIGRLQIQPRLDVYNVLNSDAVNSFINRYGATWLQPQEVFGARMLKLGMQLDF